MTGRTHRKAFITAVLVPLALILAACDGGGVKPPADGGEAGGSTIPTAGSPRPGSSPTAASGAGGGKPLPSGLTTGKLEATITGAVTKTIHLDQVSQTFGAPGAEGVGPGYKFYATDQDGLTLRLPAGPVGTELSSTSLDEPLQVDYLPTNDLFHEGACTVKLSTVSATELRGTLGCRGLKGATSGATIDLTGTFELTS